ncbi:hypothetical protein FJZ53_00420 [Candidatus Woesearchaeota archaeon]|nr:hypothetical protein [Candidatus Woesearchaeota archaeon]
MIAQNDWFERRKYTGWGLGRPRKWQGWAYLAAVLLPFVIFQAIPYWGVKTRLIVTGAWMAFLMIDLIPLMVTLKKDEREHKIEAIAERNAAWAMVMILVIGIVYEALRSALAAKTFQVDPFIIAALFGGVIAKALSNFYLERRAI